MSSTNLIEELRNAHLEWRQQVVGERCADRALYSDHAGRPMLRSSVVTYLDELGAKDRILQMTDADLRRDIERRDDLAETLHSGFYDGDRQRVISFSDNVAVATPLPNQSVTSTVAEIHRHADACSEYQLALALDAIPLRGGISLGPAFCDREYVVGPAHLEAVLLEEQHADVPRVLVADSIVTVLRQALGTAARHRWPDDLYVVDGTDERAFINYLLAAKPGASGTSLTAHRSVVMDQLARLASDPRPLAKWEWVARYHNWFVDTYAPDPALQVQGHPSGTFHSL